MKHFRNKTWSPQMRLLVCAVMVFLMLPCLPSCENNLVQPKKDLSVFENPELLAELEDAAETLRENVGEIHNRVIKRFYDKKPNRPGEKVSEEDYRRIFRESFNEELYERGLRIQLTDNDVKKVMEALADFMKDTGIDICNPQTIDPSEALDKLATRGYITEADASHCKHITKCLEEGINPYEDGRGILNASGLSEEAEMYEDVITESYQLWTEELYPLFGWDWHSLMEKIGPYIADGLGGIAGGIGFSSLGPIAAIIGGAAGAMLASIAFETITWLGNMGYI